MIEKKDKEREIQEVLTDLVVWNAGSELRIIGRLKAQHSRERFIENAVRIDVDVLGRSHQGLLKSPNMASIDYSKTPIPRFYVDFGSHYFVRDLDEVSAKFTASMYIEFCRELNNWEAVEEERRIEALRQQAQQRNMIAMPGVPVDAAQLAKMVPIPRGMSKR